ncbi:DEAD/DEAH box helicase [Aquibium microcysteis]|uniref:DEAD/DEAH box helicase n=1 Tax=Aquibium microcysteis TaxID=675281 RepID=UPI001EF35FCE|nr:DEAD/DEAH box helicase family protein [Aquibium microcysteis]
MDRNTLVREPQREAFAAIDRFVNEGDREAGVVLPVGCGKSGTIAISPFAFKSNRTLVVAPNLNIARQLLKEFDPANVDMFYQKAKVIGAPYPEPVEIRGKTTNRGDLDVSDVVVTNIQQLQGDENRWLQDLPDDYFDLILFDEGHHNVAASWDLLKAKFPAARIVNFSATPMRSDGQLMAGKIIYSYPVARAIRAGYVKRLKAVVLNPKTLRYVRREDGQEIEVSLDEVRRLGEDDSGFRRSIVSSEATMTTIVDASIRELDRLRKEAGDNNLKIIASALNFVHCGEIVKAYRARGRRADYVHSLEDGKANDKVMKKLENNELDVIVQVRKLGEGFDHPRLAVAAVFSIFANLSPFVQFVGRIMRVVMQNAPDNPVNRGVVVFHAGANVARRWSDFQSYTGADQEFFDALLPMEELDFSRGDEIEIDPVVPGSGDSVQVRSQTEVQLEEIPLIEDDAEAQEMIRKLRERGYTGEVVARAMNQLDAVPVTKVRQRQAHRAALDIRIKTEVGRIFAVRKINHQGYDLDRRRLNKTNFVVMKGAIDDQANKLVGRKSGERGEFTQGELDRIEADFAGIVERATKAVFDA